MNDAGMELSTKATTCADCKFYHATRTSDGEVVYWRECQRCHTKKLTGDEHAAAIKAAGGE